MLHADFPYYIVSFLLSVFFLKRIYSFPPKVSEDPPFLIYKSLWTFSLESISIVSCTCCVYAQEVMASL